MLYAGAKHEAEALCQSFAAQGLPVVTVNPVEIYGPEDEKLITASYIRDTLKDWPAMAVSGGTSVVHVEDVAEGILLALFKGRAGERYILGGENLTVRRIIELTLEVAGLRKWVLQLPNWLIKAVVKTLAFLRLPTPVLPDLLDHATLYWWMDSGKSQRELGYRFRGAREAIADVVKWLKESGRV
ncbi:MAG: NAD-dependent epimerase/dehydratase family protein [Myxococcaceae bacterium]